MDLEIYDGKKAEEKELKPWSFALRRGGGHVAVVAVDPATGNDITTLIGFMSTGDVVVCERVYDRLRDNGYDLGPFNYTPSGEMKTM